MANGEEAVERRLLHWRSACRAAVGAIFDMARVCGIATTSMMAMMCGEASLTELIDKIIFVT